jgi:phospholipid/cholesterol/gamma-HCH transport system substrate-binding protein
MNERRMQFRVGVTVFATIIAGGLLATLYDPLPTGWLPWGRSTYRVKIELPRAPGIGQNSPVRRNGILIGRVHSIEDKGDGVVLHTDVETDRPLQTNQVPHIRTSVLGDATIDFETEPSNVPPQPLADGAVISGRVDPQPLEAIAKLGDLQEDFANASRALGGAGREVEILARRINEAFGNEDANTEGRVARLIDTTERAMNQFGSTMTSINEIIGDAPQPGVAPQQPPVNGQPAPGAPVPNEGQQLRRRVRQGLNELPDAVREARVTMQQFRGTLELANTNLRNLEGFTEPLGQKGEEIAAALIQAIEGLDTLVKDFTALTNALNNREGTVGRLIHEGQVYENLNRLMCNANVVLGRIDEFVKSLRPIRDDVRAFTHKIALEPGRLVKGAVGPSSTTK